MSTLACGSKGGVKAGVVGPYTATNGFCNAAAICINPESLLTTAFASDNKSMASSSDVFPVKLTHCCCVSVMIFSNIHKGVIENS